MVQSNYPDSEDKRLTQNREDEKSTEKWGPYLSERQWGTVREDYSADGNAWDYFTHDQARSRAYRWGEDGIAGISDNQQFICFAPAFWNGKDPIIKERLFGLNNHEGNHGEDVKELYYYLENTPTHAYMKFLYKYPIAAFPYDDLVIENEARSKEQPEYEILDTGVFDNDNYFDILIEYAKNGPDDILIHITVKNRSAKTAILHILPTVWFRNQWSFGLSKHKPQIGNLLAQNNCHSVKVSHHSLDDYRFYFKEPTYTGFTENETNTARINNEPNDQPFKKDFFNDSLISGNTDQLKQKTAGTKFSPIYKAEIEADKTIELRFRLSTLTDLSDPLGLEFDFIFAQRMKEGHEFFDSIFKKSVNAELLNISRQAIAGMLWSKQFYYYTVEKWLEGDKINQNLPLSRLSGRNANWKTLNNRDILAMPDKWEYPWYASWDLAFHTLPMALVDPLFAKEQLITITREWYMHPDGQLPAYEWNFNDSNPPVQAWAALRIYHIEKSRTNRTDVAFLKRIFIKLIINFTWWVNKKDVRGLNVFEGGFLGLDNIGIFDRSQPVPGNSILEQADGTAWMARYALNMLDIALEIAQYDKVYEDVASKFYEHFMYISEAYNSSWNAEDHFFYDQLVKSSGEIVPIKVRSLVGVISTFAVTILESKQIAGLNSFCDRMKWFSMYRKTTHKFLAQDGTKSNGDYLLSLVARDRLLDILKIVLDEDEFLSPWGLRSVSKFYQDQPYSMDLEGQDYSIDYEPGEATGKLFGGNSNWRGPIWMPLNFLFIEMLGTYHNYYGDTLKVECPARSGQFMNLFEVAAFVSNRLVSMFLKDADGNKPIHGKYNEFYKKEGCENLLLFHEYFHGETGMGLGASHQTGWTSLIAGLISVFELSEKS